MMSKNELKANHNLRQSEMGLRLVGKYDVKERIESKSQPGRIHRETDRVGKYDVKERIESKSQLKKNVEIRKVSWQI